MLNFHKFRTTAKVVVCALVIVFILLAQSGSQGPLLMQNAGTPLGAAITLNCSTNTTCTNSGGTVTLTAASGGISGLTTNAIVNAASATSIQTPCASCTLDSSGNLTLSGVISSGAGSGLTGALKLTGATSGNTVTFTVPATTSAGTVTFPGGGGSGAQFAGTIGAGQCVQSSGTAGLLATTGSACGSGGGGTTVQTGTIETISACSTSAFLYLITDSAYNYAYCNGSSTLTYFLNGQQVTPPTGTFAWTNQGSATVTTQTNGLWSFAFPNHGASTNSLNLYLESTPTTPFTQNYRFTSAMQSSGSNMGVALQESGTGRVIVAMIQGAGDTGDCGSANAPCFQVFSATSPTGTFASLAISSAFSLGYRYPITIQVSVASGATGNITISYATDDTGVNFIQLYQAAKNTFFTTAPDHVGIFGNNGVAAGKPLYMSLLSIN